MEIIGSINDTGDDDETKKVEKKGEKEKKEQKKEKEKKEQKKEKEKKIQKKEKEMIDLIKPGTGLPGEFGEFLKIFLITHLIILFSMFVMFGLNHLLLYVVSTTVTLRIYFGVKYNKPDYYNKGLYFTTWLFVFNAIEITIRFFVSFFTYKIRDDIVDLREMKMIETDRFLWFKGFRFSFSGYSTVLILGFFMAFWGLLILLLNANKPYFDFEDRREDEKYLPIIHEFYNKKPFFIIEGGELDY